MTPPHDDLDLDDLLARARVLGPDDLGAGERFLTRRRARTQRRRAAWLSAALASAAVVAGLSVLRPAPALPPSAAYDAYQHTWGEGW
ncbi:hypothetical protein LAJ19_13280 [Deinococcus taeanensis]|uniref:hypothetical protein n=1 Tax=Deinococcus taeanensis TaxID=2737050 RepID=UPI001CDB7AE6|nr:hypothetical protein [Deinococcus taeanensis]UBV42581.1 hypothetical protein LAJ19_13280 [Deinococcus taeanensis]